jgi:hypothetical protein
MGIILSNGIEGWLMGFPGLLQESAIAPLGKQNIRNDRANANVKIFAQRMEFFNEFMIIILF